MPLTAAERKLIRIALGLDIPDARGGPAEKPPLSSDEVVKKVSYTVKEIDDLRDAVENRLIWGSYAGLAFEPGRGGAAVGREVKDKAKAIEEMVLTHMIAGHVAEDLVASEGEQAVWKWKNTIRCRINVV